MYVYHPVLVGNEGDGRVFDKTVGVHVAGGNEVTDVIINKYIAIYI